MPSVFELGIIAYYVLSVGAVGACLAMIAADVAPQHHAALLGMTGFIVGRFSNLVSDKLVQAETQLLQACRHLRTVARRLSPSASDADSDDDK